MWLSFTLAAEQVERELGVTGGAAQKALLEACNSNAVKWQRRAFGGPDIWDKDLLAWLAKQGQPKQRTAYGRKLAQQAITALWPDGIPPTVLNKRIEQQVSDWLKKDGQTSVSRDTILRAAGRKSK